MENQTRKELVHLSVPNGRDQRKDIKHQAMYILYIWMCVKHRMGIYSLKLITITHNVMSSTHNFEENSFHAASKALGSLHFQNKYKYYKRCSALTFNRRESIKKSIRLIYLIQKSIAVFCQETKTFKHLRRLDLIREAVRHLHRQVGAVHIHKV